MDKRTVIFVLLVGITFVGMNIFFGRQRDQQNRELLKQNEAKKTKEQLALHAEIETRTAKIEQLPIVSIYPEAEKTTPIASGVNINGNTLTLSWNENLPKIIYVDGKPQNLMTKDAVKNGPAVYAPTSFTTFNTASVPEAGMYEVQLVTLGPKPEVFVGELREGELTILSGGPAHNAIVLYKTQEGWLPLGFYESRGELYVELQTLPILKTYAKPLAPPQIPTTEEKEQKFYVLENSYIQLVFSNVGGALTEINLPFRSESNTKSVVNEIGFDREIAKDEPANARFPAHPYYLSNSKEKLPPGAVGGYYPLLRRGVWNKKTVEISPEYYALNLVSEYPEMAELVYQVKSFTSNSIVFEATQPHRKITKTYTLVDKAPYVFGLDIQIEGDSRGLWLTSGVPEVEIMSNRSSPQIQYRVNRKGKSHVEKLSLPKPNESVSVSSAYPDWVVDSNGYLGVIIDPLSETSAGFRANGIPGTRVPTRLSVIDPKYNPYPASKYPGYQALMPIPSKGGSLNIRVYSGPFEEGVLKTVDKYYSDPATGYNPNYLASRTFYGWFSFISKPFAKILFVVMSFFYTITHSWGLSIILLTVFLRLLLYPLNAWSIKSMRRMQKLSPQIQAIQARHKKDPKKAQIEIMTLYRENKVNPFTGCIPILIQIPFLIAMFDLLKSSFQLRGAVFIPGWIDNLTAPDVLFQWSTPIFFIGTQLHLLPFLLGGVMFIQQRFFSQASTKDPSKMTDQQRQQRAMGSIMTVVFVVMFYHFPSGLNLYWLSSMTLGIFQQWITNKILDKKEKGGELIIPQKKRDTKKRK